MSYGRLILAGVQVLLASSVHASGLVREANTTLSLPPTPPVYGYTTVPAFPGLSVTDPVAIASPPGETNRLFIVEQRGRIVVVTNLASPNRTVFLDLSSRVVGGAPNDERGLLGLAFHPGYATNRMFFVFYSLNSSTPGIGNNVLHQRVSRLLTSVINPNLADPNSEVVLINQRDEAGNHNGGDLHFGPDGYLYIAVGDEGSQNDNLGNSQRIDKDFFAGLLRIDVDERPGSLPANPHPANTNNPTQTVNYAIPPDNPFVGATSFNGQPIADPSRVRTEFYATGMRNPWRFSFDSLTGWLYCGDVGQGTWEEIDVITSGGNYGWNYFEGAHAGPRTPPAGFTAIPPIYEYRHGSGTTQGYSVTGGRVYRGAAMSQLYGHYVFGDYVSGNIWAIRYDGTNVAQFRRLLGEGGVAGFGEDPRNGDILLANQTQDVISRLVYAANPIGAPLPPTLADTGAFTNLATLATAPGIVPYDLNVPFWSDNARKTRWFSIPDVNRAIGFEPNANWSFPSGMVWIKHFELELTNGVPESAKRLETRFIFRNAGGVYGLTYRWGDSTNNAALVPEEGLDETLVIHDGGLLRTQVWHYPSRGECLICHTPLGGFALGFSTAQLNRKTDYGNGPENQLLALSHAGYFSNALAQITTLPAMAPADDRSVSLEYRVRSYLAANCAQCHAPGGIGMGLWDARLETLTDQAGLIHGPLRDLLGDPDNRVVVPGDTTHSMLLARISTAGLGRMPPLASSVLDTQAIQLVTAWITNELAGRVTFEQWQSNHFEAPLPPEADLEADPDRDGANNRLEFLTGTDPLDATKVWRPEALLAEGRLKLVFDRQANRGYELLWTTNLTMPGSWQVLDHPDNRPRFSASNEVSEILENLSGHPARFFRVRVFEP